MAKPATSPIPGGMHTVTPHLWFSGRCREALEFYKRAFDVKVEAEPAIGPDGKSVLHAMVRIGDSQVMMADAMPGAWEQGPAGSASAGLWLYVPDCDALFHQAVGAGCEVIYETMDAFWGDRMGKVKDPFGHCWAIATHKQDLTGEEIARGQEAWFASMKR